MDTTSGLGCNPTPPCGNPTHPAATPATPAATPCNPMQPPAAPRSPNAPVGGERVHEHPRAGDQVAEEDDLDDEDGEAQHGRVEVELVLEPLDHPTQLEETGKLEQSDQPDELEEIGARILLRAAPRVGAVEHKLDVKRRGRRRRRRGIREGGDVDGERQDGV